MLDGTVAVAVRLFPPLASVFVIDRLAADVMVANELSSVVPAGVGVVTVVYGANAVPDAEDAASTTVVQAAELAAVAAAVFSP